MAERGTVLKNESGSYLGAGGRQSCERFEVGKRDPALVAFGRYAFDMSKFSARAATSRSASASAISGS